jgi:hypothetical protein
MIWRILCGGIEPRNHELVSGYSDETNANISSGLHPKPINKGKTIHDVAKVLLFEMVKSEKS